MKKKSVINLIKYYTENNDVAFREEAYEIAREFDQSGDSELAQYISALLSDTNVFVPQMNDDDLSFFTKIEPSNKSLPLPDAIAEDIIGMVNAVNKNIGINKFLFEGNPGTGKTETVKHLARLLDRDLFMVNIESLIDSKLGQTSKNIVDVFDQINNLSNPQKAIILFDEIDALALNRTDSNDLREMGRVTSTLLRRLDNLNDSIVLIATTNLYQYLDKALTRRFDAIINFDRYTEDDLMDIAQMMMNQYLSMVGNQSKNTRLFKKIIKELDPIPYPGELDNMIKSAIAFSKQDDRYDYLKRLYRDNVKDTNYDIKHLQKKGYTLREIEILTGISKSTASRQLKE